jgi:SAM-dependent methyltransferase
MIHEGSPVTAIELTKRLYPSRDDQTNQTSVSHWGFILIYKENPRNFLQVWFKIVPRDAMTENYYNQLTPHYRHIYKDWNQSVQHQAEVLDEIIGEHFGKGVKTILDAACGIGTQSIGLAEHGYQVSASDISSSEIDEARLETHKRNLSIHFEVVDMRFVWNHYGRQFDLVIACDNAIPHLLSDDEIGQTFDQFYQCVAPNGGCMISVRDYASMERENYKLYPRQVHESEDEKIVIFDYWKFDGDFYDMTTYIIEDKGQPLATTHVVKGGRYYCISINRLEQLMQRVGFEDVTTIRDRFFQPLIIGRKKAD